MTKDQGEKNQVIVDLVELFVYRMRQLGSYDPDDDDLFKKIEDLAEKVVEEAWIRVEEL